MSCQRTPRASRMATTSGTGACIAASHFLVNFRAPPRQYPKGTLTRKVPAATSQRSRVTYLATTLPTFRCRNSAFSWARSWLTS